MVATRLCHKAGSQRLCTSPAAAGPASACNAAGNCPQSNGSPGRCDTPDGCQFVFYWGWPLSPLRSPFVNDATQMDAIDALTAALAVDPRAA